jgi:hypothetical protein
MPRKSNGPSWHQFNRSLLATFLSVFLVLSCASKKIFYQREAGDQQTPGAPIHSIYFFGSADEAETVLSAAGPLLSDDIASQSGKVTVLMLGNNMSKLSFLDSAKIGKNQEAMAILQDRFDFIRSLKGNAYAVPGPREWDNGGPKGNKYIRLWERYLETRMGYGDIVKPDQGCPGPEEIVLSEDLVLLLIDTQWWLQDWAKTGIEEGCDVDSHTDFLVNLDDAIKRNYNKKIIIAGHHAIMANGARGGHFPFRSHMVPLPGLGSIYVLYRKLLGDSQDLSNPKYRQMIRAFRRIFNQHDNLIYLSGNELSLEYHRDSTQHYINAGSLAKSRDVAQKNAVFAAPKTGFGVLRFYRDGSVRLEFLSGDQAQDRVLFSEQLFQSEPFKQERYEAVIDRIDFTDSTTTGFATRAFLKKRKRPGMMGNNYSMEWATAIANVPYFDIDHEHGGLKVIKRGGGMQTKSMRLEDRQQRQFVLRSIEKYPENAIPDELRGTIAENVVTSQISASHPYGALVVPYLADAAGVYHTNPKLVWLADDPRLGIYRELFEDGLYLYEERPDEEHKNVSSFGYTKKIVSTPTVVEHLIEDSDHFIDQQHVLRSRLFDILIGDWDRHDDQWRWSAFDNESGFTYYRPIPRDRDQAFFWSDGWLMKLATRRWGMPKFQGFHHKIRDVAGLSFNARYFDRTFLTELQLEDWVTMAEELQGVMTDEVIEDAIEKFPPEIFALHGKEIISKLKSRRDDLPVYAADLYRFLAREVDVTGSDDSDLFKVERLSDEETKVTVFRAKESTGEIKYKTYERVFKTSETREVRLYGFDDTDRFILTGDVSKGIRIRIIGGREKDIVEDHSRVSGPVRHTVVYDKRKSTRISDSPEVRDRTSNKDPLINLYDREAFQYNVTMPLLYASYNPDDGIFIGAGALITTHGFRKDPFKTRHLIRADIAPRSQSYNFSYKGQFTDLFGKWDFILNARISAPSFADNFYGFGNETIFDQEKFDRDRGYYRTRYVHYVFHPEVEWTSNNEFHRFLIGGGYQSINIRSDLNESGIEDQERFIISYAESLPYDLLDVQRHYLGLYANYTFDNTNSELQPTRGFRYRFGVLNIGDADQASRKILFSRFQSSLAYYYSFGNSLKSTLALRAGGMANVGDYEFYHASRLGGTTNFRGVRRFRLAGNQAFYQNTELRVKLFAFKSPVVPGDFGLTFFHDVGRVWYKDDPSAGGQQSGKWHRGYGGGIWLAPLSKAAIGVDYSWSTLDESAFFLRMGFFF